VQRPRTEAHGLEQRRGPVVGARAGEIAGAGDSPSGGAVQAAPSSSQQNEGPARIDGIVRAGSACHQRPGPARGGGDTIP